jgi:hypothetical protein
VSDRVADRAANGRTSTAPSTLAAGSGWPAIVAVTVNGSAPAGGKDACGTLKPTRTVSSAPGASDTVSGANHE